VKDRNWIWFVVFVVICSLACYLHTKNSKTLFHKKYKDSFQVKDFIENLLKIPVAIINPQKTELVFANSELINLFKEEERDNLLFCFNFIKLGNPFSGEKSESGSPLIRSAQKEEPKPILIPEWNSSLKNLLKFLKITSNSDLIQLPEILCYLRKKKYLQAEEPKLFNLAIREILWEEQNALLLVFNDVPAEKKNFLPLCSETNHTLQEDILFNLISTCQNYLFGVHGFQEYLLTKISSISGQAKDYVILSKTFLHILSSYLCIMDDY